MVRCHLGQIVPEPRRDVRIKVYDSILLWEEGKCMMFDDAYKHAVWNDTEEVRVAPMIDVRRPLPGWLTAVNKTLIGVAGLSPEIRRIVRRQREWDSQQAAA